MCRNLGPTQRVCTKVYQAALKQDPVAPLRLSIAVDLQKTPAELFRALPLDDAWVDADISSVFEYLYSCKHVRTASFARFG